MKWKFFAGLFVLLGVSFFWVAWRSVYAIGIPTSVIATPAETVVTESAYQWYENINSLTPVTPLAPEDVPIATPPPGTQLRLLIGLTDADLPLPAGATFVLQYADATSGPWTDLGTSTPWAFFDNPSVYDGQIIYYPLLASSTMGESYGESNPSAISPFDLNPGDVGEWDWAVVNQSADTASNWFFRMAYASGTPLEGYAEYQSLTGVPPTPPPTPSSTPPSYPSVNVGGGTGYYPSSTSSTLPVAPPTLPPKFQPADFNGDNRVDIIDFSILLYYYGRTDPAALRYDLDGNGSVGFDDISILLYYWTGF